MNVNGSTPTRATATSSKARTSSRYKDVFLPDGGLLRTFRPLWWRTWRYIELTVETKDEPLTINDLRATFAAYPFEFKAKFEAPAAPEIAKILEVGWRTARLASTPNLHGLPVLRAVAVWRRHPRARPRIDL